ncbi:cupin domain-containing protein [Croceicoccus sp. Ery5]|jgi:quercetin dioxygenase-like cupin family protein|uniref:cupin domain-containing protein n=1 Tax=Croceicoccus sp. Ery5 TaxID=1703340 RepID=UPI001E3C39C6|nr:cupin domain-containing protein [Croceicoccus sp. Ery5]
MRLAALLLLGATIPLAACNTAEEAPTEEAGHTHGEGGHTHDVDAVAEGDIKDAELVAATDISPEYLQLATNVEVIPSLEAAVKSPATVMTHEGLFGPLLFAEETRAFFIELQPGMFLAEHPHPIGSIVYTVRGKWVLASEGKRQVMEEGSLFRFGDGMPTGWEAPFNEPALLLIVKPKGESTDYKVFNEGIKDMQQTVEADRQKGGAYYYDVLEEDHPAIKFARSVNPEFDSVLAQID